ncbi:MAG: hypothetical protein ACQETK_05700 [Pseudomonadota bacterium]
MMPRNENAPGAATTVRGAKEHSQALNGENSTDSRRLPPYARQRLQALRDPLATVWVPIGSGVWGWTRQRPAHLILPVPPGEDPAHFDWRCCAGHEPILVVRCGAVDGDRMERLLRTLLRDGVRRVLDDTGVRYLAEGVDLA